VTPSRAAASLIAERLGCLLEYSYHRVNGFDLRLWAPDGKAFVSSGDQSTANLFGQCYLLDEMDWSKTIASIRSEISAGFIDVGDEEEEAEG